MKIEVHCAVCGKPFMINLPEEAWRLQQKVRPNMKYVCGNPCGAEDVIKLLAEKKIKQ